MKAGRGPRARWCIIWAIVKLFFQILLLLALANVITANEQQVDWICNAITWLDEQGYTSIEPTPEAQEAWVGHVLGHGAGWSDAVLFAHAFRAVETGDWPALDAVADLAAALRATAELALESGQQGASFLAITRAAWPAPALDRLAALRDGRPVPLPVAQATALAGWVPLPAALAAMLGAFAASLVSAGVRLVPLGQTDGQRATAALMPVVARTAARALGAALDDVGTAAPMVDWASMRHETQYTRLFRS